MTRDLPVRWIFTDFVIGMKTVSTSTSAVKVSFIKDAVAIFHRSWNLKVIVGERNRIPMVAPAILKRFGTTRRTYNIHSSFQHRRVVYITATSPASVILIYHVPYSAAIFISLWLKESASRGLTCSVIVLDPRSLCWTPSCGSGKN